MKHKLIMIFMISLIIIFESSISYGKQQSGIIGSYYNNQNLGIQAYKQINAFQLTLADGSIIADGDVTTKTVVNVTENFKDVEMIFILDTSGSMWGTRCEITKNSTKALVQSLFGKIGKEHLKIGVLFFNNGVDMKNILEMTDDENTILTHLDKIYASGGTEMLTSLVKAREMLNSDDSSNDNIKIVCTLTDGGIWDESQSIEVFKKLNNEGISTMSIFADTPVTPAFQNLKSGNHKNFQTNTANLENTISNQIYKEIYKKILSTTEPETTYELNNVGMIAGDNKIIMQMDDEIIHGATLKIEYIINIWTEFKSNDIKIKDYCSDSLKFNQNEKMLTENKTNKDYNWNMDANGVIIHNSGSKGSDAEHAYKVKLVLSTVLTKTNFDKFENSITFSLKNTENKSVIEGGVNENEKIKSLGFLIIPPTGIVKTKNIILTTNMVITVIFLTAVILDILPKKKKSKKMHKT